MHILKLLLCLGIILCTFFTVQAQNNTSQRLEADISFFEDLLLSYGVTQEEINNKNFA